MPPPGERKREMGLLPATAIELVAVEARRLGREARVALAFGSELRVLLSGSGRGVEVWIEPGAALRSAARAELPGLLAALRGRGVVVARAGIAGEAAAGRAGATAPARRAR